MSQIYVRGVCITTFAKRSITKAYDACEFDYEHEERTTIHRSNEIKEMKSEKSKSLIHVKVPSKIRNGSSIKVPHTPLLNI